ncbi:hypothetical protein ES703_120450 [subsurface metagenome]
MKGKNNRGAAPGPDEDSHAVEAFFMRLGNVLAEIARDMVQREANGNQDLSKNHANRNQNKKRKD